MFTSLPASRRCMIPVLAAAIAMAAINTAHAAYIFDYTGTGTASGDDSLSPTINTSSFGISSFNFFGTSYTQFKIASNGVLSPAQNVGSGNYDNGGWGGNFNAIAPLWDDLNAPSSVRYGAAQRGVTTYSNVMAVTWNTNTFSYGSGTIGFQAAIFTANTTVTTGGGSFNFLADDIAFSYQSNSITSFANSNQAAIGVQKDNTLKVGAPIAGATNGVLPGGSAANIPSGESFVLFRWNATANSYDASIQQFAAAGDPNFIYTDTSALTVNVLVGSNTSAGAVVRNIQNNGASTGDATVATANANLSFSGTLTNISSPSGTAPVSFFATSTASYQTTTGTANVLVNAGGSNVINTTVNVGNAVTGPANTFGAALSGISTGVALASKTSATEAIAELVDSGSSMTMAWRTALAGETYVQGDVVQITTNDPNVYVLKMTYGSDVNENSFFLGELIAGNWNNAGFDANLKLGAWSGQNTLGQWGIDTTGTGGYVWAVVNGGGTFAVIPEPASLLLVGLGALGLLARRRGKA